MALDGYLLVCSVLLSSWPRGSPHCVTSSTLMSVYVFISVCVFVCVCFVRLVLKCVSPQHTGASRRGGRWREGEGEREGCTDPRLHHGTLHRDTHRLHRC